MSYWERGIVSLKTRERREHFGTDDLLKAYQIDEDAELSNAELYNRLAEGAGLRAGAFQEKSPVGKSRANHSLIAREARWLQQDLKAMGILTRVDGRRGVWKLTEKGKRNLHASKPGVKLLGYSTSLGVAIWGASEEVFRGVDIPISLCLTSPPYCLAGSSSRAYGNPCEKEIVNFICNVLEPVVEALQEDGSIVVNTTNDAFIRNSPARSTYLERLVLTICDRFQLHLMERLVWESSKPPGPMQWASRTRQQLNVAYEPILVFSKNPLRWKADNRRVLQPHSEQHLKLIARGGENRQASYSDGAYRIRPGSYSNPTAGRIPKNILKYGQRCRYGIQYRKACTELGLPVHGAGMAFKVPEFLIQWLTEPGDHVVDVFGGRGMTALAADMLNRTWMIAENQLEYIRGGAELFRGRPGFELNPDIEAAFARG
ncbi:site-specific DNA-methyltransferase [Pseudomonas aeruginosa]|nr:site-specific DNA-methyltransferase [Pseudomonas aeruginosa]